MRREDDLMDKNDIKDISKKGFDSDWWGKKAAKDCRGIGVEKALKNCRKALIGRDGLPTKVTDFEQLVAATAAYNDLEKELKKAKTKCGMLQKDTKKGIEKHFLPRITEGRRALNEKLDEIERLRDKKEDKKKKSKEDEGFEKEMKKMLQPIVYYITKVLPNRSRVLANDIVHADSAIDELIERKVGGRAELRAELDKIIGSNGIYNYNNIVKEEKKQRKELDKYNGIIKELGKDYPSKKKSWMKIEDAIDERMMMHDNLEDLRKDLWKTIMTAGKMIKGTKEP